MNVPFINGILEGKHLGLSNLNWNIKNLVLIFFVRRESRQNWLVFLGRPSPKPNTSVVVAMQDTCARLALSSLEELQLSWATVLLTNNFNASRNRHIILR